MKADSPYITDSHDNYIKEFLHLLEEGAFSLPVQALLVWWNDMHWLGDRLL